MTAEEIKQGCLEQLLFGQSFLVSYAAELDELVHDHAFLERVNQIGNEVSLSVQFPMDKNAYEHIKFKKEYLYNRLYEDGFAKCFPAFMRIYGDVIKQGKAGLSAIISVYYAMRYLSVEGVRFPGRG